MLGVERMCHLAVVSRAGYYRHWEEVVPDEAEMAARVSIQEVVLRHRRRYGYRRVTADLHRQGMVINHKRVARIMREDNLLAIRYRKYILTTDSKHDCQVYLNLAARMTVTAVNQFWVADITYILGGHLKTGHRGSLQNRPTGRSQDLRLLYRVGGRRGKKFLICVAMARHPGYTGIAWAEDSGNAGMRPERRPRGRNGGGGVQPPQASHSGPKAINPRGLGTESPRFLP
jgi:hypothetical protein